MKIKLKLILELHLILIFIGKITSIRIHYFFRIYADFEADNEIDISIIGNETTDIYKQNPVLNGYHIESELEDVLLSSYYKSPLGYKNVDWCADEVIKLENKLAF